MTIIPLVCTVRITLPPKTAAEPTADPCQRLPNDDLLYGANGEAVGSLPVEWYWDVGLD
jgi:hypothetical protein